MDNGRKIVAASLHHPERSRKCMDCGVVFTAFGHADRCDSCRRIHLKEYQRKYIRPSRRKARLEREQRRNAELGALAPASAGMSVLGGPAHAVDVGRCRFCGREVRNGVLFCARCMREGFNEVYAVTGRSNGWDRKAV